jgi:hypothetical protein
MSGSFGGPSLSTYLIPLKIVYRTSNLRDQKCASKRRVLERNGALSAILLRTPFFTSYV